MAAAMAADGLPTEVETCGAPRSDAAMPAVSELRFLACASALSPDVGRDPERGDEGSGSSSCIVRGDPDSEPALNGWKETEVRRPRPSRFRSTGGLAEMDDVGDKPAARPAVIGREFGGSICGRCSMLDGRIEFVGELVSEPIVRTALRAEMGLVPRASAPWNVDRLPYVCCG